MKKLFIFCFFSIVMQSIGYAQTVCFTNSKINSVVASTGNASVHMETLTDPRCGCSPNTVAWIDQTTSAGKSMLAIATGAKLANKVVTIGYQGQLGQGTPGNMSLSWLYWANCKMTSIQLL